MIVREGGIPFCFSTSVVGDIMTKIELGRSMVEMLGVLAITVFYQSAALPVMHWQ